MVLNRHARPTTLSSLYSTRADNLGWGMLFNSSEFILVFLPVALAGYFAFARLGVRFAAAWLTSVSLFFYAWWNPAYLPFLLASLLFNWAVGRALVRRPRRWMLVLGIATNLLLLGYFKYTGFFVQVVDNATGAGLNVPEIVLPLAISFFTFQQIAFLSDSYDGVAEEPDFLRYCLFVTFFPHLIAGPITHHREMLPQFSDPSILRPKLDLFSIGLTLFLIGLFKKVILADTMAGFATPGFAAAQHGEPLTVINAWGAVLAYSLQLYFDFSGYTDMAIGLGLLFGISLPPNFDSPYRATNIIEFWSRWHMTLTRFLTAYIYNPIVLRMTRSRVQAGKSVPRRGKTTLGAFFMLIAFPTLVTMFLSGLWHGAGWQFILFGLLHGVYLTVNHAWRTLKVQFGWSPRSGMVLLRTGSVLLTFACVLVAQVFFRAPDVPTAMAMLRGMAGLNGFPLSYLPFFSREQAYWTTALLLVIWAVPNPQQWMRFYRTALDFRPARHWLEHIAARPPLVWRPSVPVGVAIGVLGALALMRAMSSAPTEFLYFKF
jgi:D-alanyl-lipoteichoic acid acyltransferase DltB (MBOAT superfamily)